MNGTGNSYPKLELGKIENDSERSFSMTFNGTVKFVHCGQVLAIQNIGYTGTS